MKWLNYSHFSNRFSVLFNHRILNTFIAMQSRISRRKGELPFLFLEKYGIPLSEVARHSGVSISAISKMLAAIMSNSTNSTAPPCQLAVLFFTSFFFVVFSCSSASARLSREDFAFLNTYATDLDEVKTVDESSFKFQEGAGIETELQSAVQASLVRAFDYILARQSSDGSWKDRVSSGPIFTSYYIILLHYLERVDSDKQAKAARYILAQQTQEGCWASFPGGPADKSLTLMNYFALKLAGIDPGSEPMQQCRNFLEQHLRIGDIAGWDFFVLAFMGQVPLSTIAGPYPKALILIPDFLPNIKDLPTVPRIAVIPALLLVQTGSVMNVAAEQGLSDLTLFSAIKSGQAGSLLEASTFQKSSGLSSLVSAIRVLSREASASASGEQEPCAGLGFEKLPFPITGGLPQRVGEMKADAPEVWRLYAADAIDPDYILFQHIKKIPEKSGLFYANSLLTVFYLAALKNIDCARHPFISCQEVEALLQNGLAGLSALAVEDERQLFMPLVRCDIWDTANALSYVQAYNPLHRDIADTIDRAIAFLLDRQSTVVSEWKRHNPFGRPGGWGFEDHGVRLPDTDATSIVLRVLRPHIRGDATVRKAFQRGANWLLSMKNDDGGFPMFERQGDGIYNLTPLVSSWSPVKAMYDESQPEMSSRIATVMLNDLGFTSGDYEIKKLAAFLVATRSGMLWDSIWFTDYIFGTATVNRFLALAGEDATSPVFRQANEWINGRQHPDGGWGESPASFYEGKYVDYPYSSPLITSAVIASKIDQLVKSDLEDYETEFPVIKKGLEFLLAAQNEEGFWEEPAFVNNYIPKEGLHCNYGLSTKLAPYEGLLQGLKFLNSFQAGL